jgi:riboflavin kinase/FMN adenylyltransferase
MKVYNSIAEMPQITNAIVTQGTFDGVHLAHQQILKRLKQIALQTNGETVLITYEPHPRMVLFPDDHGLKLISSIDEKIALLEKQGIDHLLILPFTIEFSKWSSLQFIKEIIVDAIHTKYLVIGYNHRFGKNREGSFEHLKTYSSAYGFEVQEIPVQEIDNLSISSTKIREALFKSNCILAKHYLGYFYSFHATVVKGNQLGRQIGFPTANLILTDSDKIVPANAVYAVFVEIATQLYKGMMNIGNNPSIPEKDHTIEVHIFDFNEDLYNQRIRVHFVDKLRDEMRFHSLEDLKTQLNKDKLHAIAVLEQDPYEI